MNVKVRVYDKMAYAGSSLVEEVWFYSLEYAEQYARLYRDERYHAIVDIK